ncbi:sucrose hydrolase-like protein [Leishmania tarentolae]|uniref:Sucrose hydrolase-like protein n=1 Tax=Leishmania tarentolae TaxID=5689 RepID=A0A640K9H2_LEITA|nr:sucrose hydrolase-like protein [Leishmania tarentolae]
MAKTRSDSRRTLKPQEREQEGGRAVRRVCWLPYAFNSASGRLCAADLCVNEGVEQVVERIGEVLDGAALGRRPNGVHSVDFDVGGDIAGVARVNSDAGGVGAVVDVEAASKRFEAIILEDLYHAVVNEDVELEAIGRGDGEGRAAVQGRGAADGSGLGAAKVQQRLAHGAAGGIGCGHHGVDLPVEVAGIALPGVRLAQTHLVALSAAVGGRGAVEDLDRRVGLRLLRVRRGVGAAAGHADGDGGVLAQICVDADHHPHLWHVAIAGVGGGGGEGGGVGEREAGDDLVVECAVGDDQLRGLGDGDVPHVDELVDAQALDLRHRVRLDLLLGGVVDHGAQHVLHAGPPVGDDLLVAQLVVGPAPDGAAVEDGVVEGLGGVERAVVNKGEAALGVLDEDVLPAGGVELVGAIDDVVAVRGHGGDLEIVLAALFQCEEVGALEHVAQVVLVDVEAMGEAVAALEAGVFGGEDDDVRVVALVILDARDERDEPAVGVRRVLPPLCGVAEVFHGDDAGDHVLRHDHVERALDESVESALALQVGLRWVGDALTLDVLRLGARVHHDGLFEVVVHHGAGVGAPPVVPFIGPHGDRRLGTRPLHVVLRRHVVPCNITPEWAVGVVLHVQVNFASDGVAVGAVGVVDPVLWRANVVDRLIGHAVLGDDGGGHHGHGHEEQNDRVAHRGSDHGSV